MHAERFSQVLVVKDDAQQRQTLCDILTDDGFEVVSCNSGVEALVSLSESDFGVAILDLSLPDLDGTKLLQQIRALDDDIRVIIYAETASDDAVLEAIDRGAFACVEKLGDPVELLEHIERACHEGLGQTAARLEMAIVEQPDAQITPQSDERRPSSHELADFASTVAHDLRSPLLTVSHYCAILKEKLAGKLDREANEYLERIDANTVRMHCLIDDLLRYAGAEYSNDPLRPVDLNVVLVEVLANLETAIRESGVQIDIGPMPIVAGFETQLVQLFQNLIDNAIKFRCDLQPKVRVEATAMADGWHFAIEDNGIGIEPQYLRQIFKVFQRLHGHACPGTGIGLAISERIVRRHNGTLSVASKPGKGTTFSFQLPATTDLPQPEAD